MRKVFAFTFLAALLMTSFGQEPVPVSAWHSDPTVALPEGTMQINDDACFGLFMELGLPAAEPKVCYLLLVADGALDMVTASFTAAGYVEAERSGEAGDRVDLRFDHPDREATEAVTLLYSDGSVFVAGHQSSAP